MPDITELLYKIKENICVLEENKNRQDLYVDIEQDFLEFMELLKLFLISERDSYYGYFLMNMKFCVNFDAPCIAGIRLNQFPPVLEANPSLLCKFTLKEVLYIICHEIDHVVLNHPAEMVKVNPENDPDIFYEFNLAADASVNDRINYEIVTESRKFLSAPQGLVTSQALSEMFRLTDVEPMENYIYYLRLISHKHNQKEETVFQNGQERLAEQNGVVLEQSLQDHHWEAGEDFEEAIVSVRELVNAAVSMMNEEIRGKMSANFMASVDKINEPPKLTWQTILKKYVGTIASGKKATRARLNRRQPERYDLSGRMDDKVLKIVVAIDTSASVDDNMISQIFNEIFAIMAKRKHEITVIECDAEVQRVYKAKSVGDVQMKVGGRGGTLFTPVIEYINSNRYYRDALLIYFTDGYGENSIPKPRTYRNIWVILEDEKNLSLKEPYGVVLKM